MWHSDGDDNKPDGREFESLRARHIYEVVIGKRLPNQMAVLANPLQQCLTFQEAADSLRQGLDQSGELGARRRLHPAESERTVGTAEPRGSMCPRDRAPVSGRRVRPTAPGDDSTEPQAAGGWRRRG